MCSKSILYIIANCQHTFSFYSTDTAIVNGDIKEPKESTITSQEAINMGVCIHTSEESSCNWQLIDYDLELEGKPQSAVTIWRTLKQWSGVKDALNETVSLVELKPKTGRHHQESPRNVIHVLKTLHLTLVYLYLITLASHMY